MKRIFALILTLACLFGLVACDIGTSATTTEKPKPTAAELKEKSSLSYVLSACDGLLVTERMTLMGISCTSKNYFEKGDNGLVMVSSITMMGETFDAGLWMNGAVYTAEDTDLSFAIVPEDDDAICASWDEEYFLPDLTGANPTVTYEGETVTVVVTVTDEYEDTVTYTYCANATTLLPISMTIEAQDGTDSMTVELTYSYPTDYTVNTAAYDAITGADDAITLTVIIDPDGAATTRTYTVSASSEISVMPMSDTMYTVYSDSDCTEEIYDLSWVTGDSATVYVAPYEFTLE